MILYSFERREHTLILESKIVQIEPLDMEKLATKVKKLKLMYWTIYLSTSDSIHTIFNSLDRSHSPLSNKYKIICLAYMYVKLFIIFVQEICLILILY